MAPKILIVDDDPTFVKLIQSLLENNSYQVITASDGDEGLEKFRTQKPDLIILDIKMPKMDGYTFVLEFKKIGDFRTTPIVVSTANASLRDIFKLEGVNDYLVKPLNSEVLLSKVHRHLKARTKKVLVVDDEPGIVEMLRFGLGVNGYEVITAMDGLEGLEKARRERPDIITLDIMIPKMDGYSICRLLKFDQTHEKTPIIIITSRMHEVDRDLSREVGADAFLIKPFEIEVLLDKIKQLIWD